MLILPKRAFKEYFLVEVMEKVWQIPQVAVQLDFVFDTYNFDSIKWETRENRGKGIQIFVRKEPLICRLFQDFMRDSNNKTELFKILAESMTHLDTSKTSIITPSLGYVDANTVETDLLTMQSRNHQESNSRLQLLVLDASSKILQKVSIVTVDTDLAVTALYHFFSLKLEDLWVENDVGQQCKWLLVHKHAAILQAEIYRALLGLL